MPFLTPFLHYFTFFRTYAHNRIFILVFISIVSTLFEGLGITLFFPLLDQGSVSKAGSEGNMALFFSTFFEVLNIPNSFESVLILTVIVFIIKGFLIVTLDSYRGYLLADVYKLINSRLAKSYSGMDYLFYLEQNTGFLNNLMTVEINQVEAAFNRFCQMISELITVAIFLCISFYINVDFTGMALVFGGFIYLLMKTVFVLSKKWSLEKTYINGILQKLLIQSIQSFKYLAATSRSGQTHSKIIGTIKNRAFVQFKLSVITAIPSLSESLMVITIATIIYYQVTIIGQPLTALIISTLVLYRVMTKVMALQRFWQAFCTMMGSIDIVSDTIEKIENNEEITGSNKINKLSDSISFNNVSFSFGEKLILKNISLKINKYSMVAVVGSSGAGKSTIVDLVTNILKPTKGEIFFDGENQQSLDMLDFRKRIGYVTQEGVVFDDSIANNINLWDSTLDKKQSSAKVKKAARLALCEEFILGTPSGYDTLIGDRGIKLSGGQRQRLAIARELYKEPDLMILDEATSSLDSVSEKSIQESVDQLKGKITMIIIAHRLSTIRNCDYIYVIESGEIVEEGTFRELISNQKTIFKKMCRLQNLQVS